MHVHIGLGYQDSGLRLEVQESGFRLMVQNSRLRVYSLGLTIWRRNLFPFRQAFPAVEVPWPPNFEQPMQPAAFWRQGQDMSDPKNSCSLLNV